MGVSRSRALHLVASILLVSCARGSSTTTTPTAETTQEVSEPRRPEGDIRSFAPDAADVRMRFDLARLRGTAFEREVATIVSGAGTWRRMGYGSESDPVRDVDVMLCFADADELDHRGILARRWTFVMRHPHDESVVRDRLSSMARASGRALEWGSRRGFELARLPVDDGGFAPHALMLTERNEVVVTSSDDVDRVADVASDHALRRSFGMPADEPWLATQSSPNEIAFIDIETRPTHSARLVLGTDQMSDRIHRFRFRMALEGSGIRVDARLRFDDESVASVNRELIAGALARAANGSLARMTGASRLADAVVLETIGDEVHLELVLDERDSRLLFAFAALAMG